MPPTSFVLDTMLQLLFRAVPKKIASWRNVKGERITQHNFVFNIYLFRIS